MKTISRRKFAGLAVLALTCALLAVASVRADEIKVVTSGGSRPPIWNWSPNMNAPRTTNL